MIDVEHGEFQTVRIIAENPHIEWCIILCDDFFDQLSLPSIKKLFRLMFSYPEINESAIHEIGCFIVDEYEAEKKRNWDMTRKTYRNGYRLNEHKKLLNAVKSAKTAYERSLKIEKIFNESKGF